MAQGEEWMRTVPEVTPAVFAEIVRDTVKHGRNLIGIGPTGIGKTAIVNQVGKELNAVVRTIRLAGWVPEDLKGMPVVVDGEVQFQPYTGFRELLDLPDDKLGILYLDELNRADGPVLNTVFQLMDRKLSGRQLPKHMALIATINPDDGEYAVNELDEAMLRRASIVKIKPNLSDWMEWAKTAHIHSSVTKFLESNPDLFYQESGETGELVTPASWESVSDIMWEKSPIQDILVKSVLKENVGTYFLTRLDNPTLSWKDLDSADKVQDILDASQKGDAEALAKIAALAGSIREVMDVEKPEENEALNAFLKYASSELIQSGINKGWPDSEKFAKYLADHPAMAELLADHLSDLL